MKWVVIGLFLVGLFFVVLGSWGNRRDTMDGQSADVAMGNSFLRAGGYFFWALGGLIVICWGLFRLMFT